MKAQIEIINIRWEGPLTPEEAYEKNGKTDYGVYQYYGDHPVYGLDVLLYIGMVSEQTFGERLREYDFGNWNQNIQTYLGRVCLEKKAVQPSDEVWGDMIDRVEKLLIHGCFPAFNSQGIATPPDANRHEELLILNWGNYRSLLPAISGHRVIAESLDESFQFMGQ